MRLPSDEEIDRTNPRPSPESLAAAHDLIARWETAQAAAATLQEATVRAEAAKRDKQMVASLRVAFALVQQDAQRKSIDAHVAFYRAAEASGLG